MTAFADDMDIELTARAGSRSCKAVDRPKRMTRRNMTAKNVIDVLHDTFLTKGHCTTGEFFLGRLEDEFYPSFEDITVFVHQVGKAEQNRCMAVMPAGVHDAGNRRTIRKVVVFIDRQCVNICPECDGRSGDAAVNHADDGIAAVAGFLGDTRLGKVFPNKCRSSDFFKRQFRMGMQIMPVFENRLFVGCSECGCLFFDVHDSISFMA